MKQKFLKKKDAKIKKISIFNHFFMKFFNFFVSWNFSNFWEVITKVKWICSTNFSFQKFIFIVFCTQKCPNMKDFFQLWVFGHLIASFFIFFYCGWMMGPSNTFFKDCMGFGEKKIWVNEVFGPKIAILGLKNRFFLWRFQTHRFRALKLL